jgi:predicted ATPase
VWFAELAPLSDAGLVPSAVAAAAGLELSGGTASPDRVADALGGKQLLLVLDNCEHVIDAAAIMAEALLRAGPTVHVIATSREPLKAEGEWLYPVPPLAVPAKDAGDEGDPLGYGAVRLFVDRARAAAPHFTPDLHLAAMIAGICRRLDGIPLAIELAASRAAQLGIKELASRLDNSFQLLTGGRRTALPRHQTLRATLDWSYGLLAEPERLVLCRLAVFAGTFDLEAASAVVASPDISPPDVVDCLLGLVTKSLLSAVVGAPIAGYRLLDTTRAYAFEKLSESSGAAAVARRHAEYYRNLFERAETEWETRPSSEWLSEYGRQIDNLRAALDWAFSPGGDASIGVALTVAAVPLWMHLSLLDECRSRAEQAVASFAPGMDRDARREMKLHAALGASLNYTGGDTAPETGVAWTKALELAEGLDDAEYQLRSLHGLWIFHTVSGRYRAPLALAQRFHTLAADRSDPGDRLAGERLIGASQHYLGDQLEARRHLERVLADYEAVDHRPSMIRFQIDLLVATRVVLARVLWLQGFPDQAMRAAERGIEDARAADHAVSLCFALAQGACQIALLVGDLAAAEHYVGMLLDHSTKHALTHWRALGTCHQGALAIKRGDVLTGSRLLRAGFDKLDDSRSGLRFLVLMMTEVLGYVGQVSEGVAELKEAIERSEQAEECWLIADLLRIKAELLLLQDSQGAETEAEGHFRRALDWARRQGALSLELRAATSLARLLGGQGRSADAAALLQPVYGRFTEGFDTADLKAAKALLDELGS